MTSGPGAGGTERGGAEARHGGGHSRRGAGHRGAGPFELPPGFRLFRRREGRWLGGVCSGLAVTLGVPTPALRVVLAMLAITAGPGVVLVYALGWALLPPEGSVAGAGSEAAPCWATRGPSPARLVDGLAVVAVVAGAVLLLSAIASWLPEQIVVPAVLAAAGAGLVWGWGGRGEVSAADKARPLLVAVGVSLVVLGGLGALAAVGDLRTLGRSAAGAAVLVAGAGLMLGPWLLRLGRTLAVERRQRIRSEERAEVAAHLHDGVLQTLALIQKRAADDREVRSLARRQERELRDWLYGPSTPLEEPDTLSALLRRELDDVEDRYGVRLEVVLVGEAPLDDAGRALVAAGREAALNAARHGGVDTIDVFLEVEPERVSLFVRDRGRGFDPAAVPADRRGLRDSIEGRVRRHGGTAWIRSAPGEGTEVELSVPRREPAAGPGTN